MLNQGKVWLHMSPPVRSVNSGWKRTFQKARSITAARKTSGRILRSTKPHREDARPALPVSGQEQEQKRADQGCKADNQSPEKSLRPKMEFDGMLPRRNRNRAQD